jgi:hypothetical protein
MWQYVDQSIFFCNKFCMEKLILIGCAWLPSEWAWLQSGWAYALQGPVMAAPLPSHVKSID